jgi:hypothetical protein
MKVIIASLLCVQLLLDVLPGHAQISARVMALGRIVMYDWFAHELTVTEDFVVETTDHQYLRVVYAPLSPEQAAKEGLKLDRLAFVGRGKPWKFDLRPPFTDQEKLYCSHPAPDADVEDAEGHTRISVYVPSPGAQNVKLPSLAALPCYILESGGMKRN